MDIAARTPTLDITLTENARKYVKNAKAKRTVRAYRSDLAHFAAFCQGRNRRARDGGRVSRLPGRCRLQTRHHEPSTGRHQ